MIESTVQFSDNLDRGIAIVTLPGKGSNLALTIRLPEDLADNDDVEGIKEYVDDLIQQIRNTNDLPPEVINAEIIHLN